MTYCLGWKTDNYAYLVADAAVSSSRPPIEERSSFGELHVQSQSKNIHEGALKVIPVENAAITFSGNAHTGNSIVHTLRMALDAGDTYRKAFERAIDSNTPFSEGKAVSVLFAYFESREPKLVSFDAQNDPSYSEYPAGEVVQMGSASQDAILSGMSKAVLRGMQDQIGEGAPLLSCVLGFCQHFGIHNNLIELGAGGTFAGCLVSAEGFFWQPDIAYLVGDLSTASPEVPENGVFVAVREDVLAVRSRLTAGPVRLFTTRRPSETMDEVKERCRKADELTLEVLRRQCFDFVVVLNTRVPVIGVIGMRRKLAHRDVIIDPLIQKDDVGLFGIHFSPELWTLLRDSYQSLEKSRSDDGYVLGLVWHYKSYLHPQFDIEHERFEVEFFDKKGNSDPEILPEVLAAYRSAKDTAGVFVQNRDGQRFGAAHFLDWLLKKKGKELEDCVPDSVKRPEGDSVIVPFTVNFTRDSFHMLTNHGPLDMKHLTLFVKITWLPTPATPRPV